MMNTLDKIIEHLSLKPRTLFLIDSAGALLTAFSLFVVLRNINEYFGMPETILTYLSAMAACLCIYSTTCFFKLKDNWAPFIIGISIANLLYCIITVSLIIFYNPLLTTIGTTYFLLEIAIVCTLVYIELNVAATIKRNKTNSNRNNQQKTML